jgi:hypothetical protein
MVDLVQSRGHEVQLHLHPEWLAWMIHPPVSGKGRKFLKDFTREEQRLLIARGLENLRASGATGVCAFRAGNYGANDDTLRALADCGMVFDTSHNSCYLGTACAMSGPVPFLQPRKMFGIHEFPISYFGDWPGHRRHAQICACSGRELQTALWGAWEQGWHAFVIVSHSFELIKRRPKANRPPAPDRTVIGRFEALCCFLGMHRDKFRTAGFSTLAPESIPEVAPCRPLASGVGSTVLRYVEQLSRRLT